MIPLFKMPWCSQFLEMTAQPTWHMALSSSLLPGTRGSSVGMASVGNLVCPLGSLELGLGKVSRPLGTKHSSMLKFTFLVRPHFLF